MIMLQMRRVRPVADSPLSSLLNSKEAKGTVAFSRRCLTFSELGADSAWWLAGPVTDEQDLFQAWHRLLGSSDDDGIANRGAVAQDGLLNSLERGITAAFGRW